MAPKTKSKTSNWMALKKSNETAFKKKARAYFVKMQALKSAQKKRAEEAETKKRGVIFLSNIPHGFFEKGMSRYFRQFGRVTRIRLARSKKTGESCGYGYVEFKYRQVAQIVASVMDGYLTFGKIMKCQCVPPRAVSQNLFKDQYIRPNNCPKLLKRRRAINKLNKSRTREEKEKRAKKLTMIYKKKLLTLKKLGIELDLNKLNMEEKSCSLKQKKKAEDINEKSIDDEDGALDKSCGDDSQHSPQKMIIEVDESDEEIQIKTPPNAVKKYVKMTSSSPSDKPKQLSSKKNTPKKKKIAAKRPLRKKLPQEEEKATEETASCNEDSIPENKVSSTLTSKQTKEAPGVRKRKASLKNTQNCKENITEAPVTTVPLPKKTKSIKGKLSTSDADISLTKTTTGKRKQGNNHSTPKNLIKKLKVMPSVTKSDCVNETLSAERTAIPEKITSMEGDTSINLKSLTKTSPVEEALIQTTEKGQTCLTSKKAKTPKKSKTPKKYLSPKIKQNPDSTDTPKKKNIIKVNGEEQVPVTPKKVKTLKSKTPKSTTSFKITEGSDQSGTPKKISVMQVNVAQSPSFTVFQKDNKVVGKSKKIKCVTPAVQNKTTRKIKVKVAKSV